MAKKVERLSSKDYRKMVSSVGSEPTIEQQYAISERNRQMLRRNRVTNGRRRDLARSKGRQSKDAIHLAMV